MGLQGFSREALLAREVGLRDPLRRASAALSSSFAARPGVFRLMWERRVPLAIAAAGLPWGAAAGYLAASTNAVPASTVRPALTALITASGAGPSVDEVIAIFGHNVLAFVLVAVLAVVTAGVSGFLLNFFPGFLLGYAAALSSWSVALGGIVPNGFVEIPAAVLAGGLAIQIGAATIHMRPTGGWTVRVLAAFADYFRALRWVIPALAVAAILEVRLG
jgi:uncharacterized membrane protein SpoIIM required for sporulation